jgi:hypothetical protein
MIHPMTYSVAGTDRMARTAKPFRLASRITEDCRSLIDQLMRGMGLSEASVIETAVRELAKREGVTPKPVDPSRLPSGASLTADPSTQPYTTAATTAAAATPAETAGTAGTDTGGGSGGAGQE